MHTAILGDILGHPSPALIAKTLALRHMEYFSGNSRAAHDSAYVSSVAKLSWVTNTWCLAVVIVQTFQIWAKEPQFYAWTVGSVGLREFLTRTQTMFELPMSS